jgi:hypothetical protein
MLGLNETVCAITYTKIRQQAESTTVIIEIVFGTVNILRTFNTLNWCGNYIINRLVFVMQMSVFV